MWHTEGDPKYATWKMETIFHGRWDVGSGGTPLVTDWERETFDGTDEDEFLVTDLVLSFSLFFVFLLCK